jgi:alkylhydroperoxidase family enzyme
MKVTDDSRSIDEADFERLEAQGFTREDIWDIAGITAFFTLSNRMMNFAAIRPDDEFYMLGRH